MAMIRRIACAMQTIGSASLRISRSQYVSTSKLTCRTFVHSASKPACIGAVIDVGFLKSLRALMIYTAKVADLKCFPSIRRHHATWSIMTESDRLVKYCQLFFPGDTISSCKRRVQHVRTQAFRDETKRFTLLEGQIFGDLLLQLARQFHEPERLLPRRCHGWRSVDTVTGYRDGEDEAETRRNGAREHLRKRQMQPQKYSGLVRQYETAIDERDQGTLRLASINVCLAL